VQSELPAWITLTENYLNSLTLVKEIEVLTKKDFLTMGFNEKEAGELEKEVIRLKDGPSGGIRIYRAYKLWERLENAPIYQNKDAVAVPKNLGKMRRLAQKNQWSRPPKKELFKGKEPEKKQDAPSSPEKRLEEIRGAIEAKKRALYKNWLVYAKAAQEGLAAAGSYMGPFDAAYRTAMEALEKKIGRELFAQEDLLELLELAGKTDAYLARVYRENYNKPVRVPVKDTQGKIIDYA
jgi:hypothetical protein